MSYITEVVSDQLRLNEGRLSGFIFYTYESPTHWGSGGVCSIQVHVQSPTKRDISIRWSSGGLNAEFSALQVAKAMAEAFEMASLRIEILHTLYSKEVV
jgi:hypothetical protein